MFSGIVEEMGVLLRAEDGRYRFGSSLVAGDLVIGDSVAVNGACLTIVDRAPGWLESDVSPETLRRTTLGDLEVGDPVNLERPVRLADRLSGHVVQGHVDAVGEVLAAAPDLPRQDPARADALLRGEGFHRPRRRQPDDFDLDEESFSVAVIPYTAEHTTLGVRSAGDPVNIEVDVTAKQVEKLLAPYVAKLT